MTLQEAKGIIRTLKRGNRIYLNFLSPSQRYLLEYAERIIEEDAENEQSLYSASEIKEPLDRIRSFYKKDSLTLQDLENYHRRRRPASIACPITLAEKYQRLQFKYARLQMRVAELKALVAQYENKGRTK